MGKAFIILWKDVLSELRTRDVVTSVLVFALLVMVIFNFTFEPGTQTRTLAPGILWVAFTFAGVLGLSRSFILEKDRGSLEGLLLSPVEREVVYSGKLLANLVFMLVVEVVAFPIFLILFNLPLFMPWLLLIAFLATVGFAAVGTLFSAIAVNTRAREIMLPLLFFPMAVPVIIAAVEATAAVLNGTGELVTWLQVMVAFDIIFLVVSALTFQFVMEE